MLAEKRVLALCQHPFIVKLKNCRGVAWQVVMACFPRIHVMVMVMVIVLVMLIVAAARIIMMEDVNIVTKSNGEFMVVGIWLKSAAANFDAL